MKISLRAAAAVVSRQRNDEEAEIQLASVIKHKARLFLTGRSCFFIPFVCRNSEIPIIFHK